MRLLLLLIVLWLLVLLSMSCGAGPRKESSDCNSSNVPTKECDKASPDSRIARSSVPHDAAEDDGTKVSGHEGINHGGSLAFDLSNNIVGPGTSKGLGETDQNHHQIDGWTPKNHFTKRIGTFSVEIKNGNQKGLANF